MISDFLTFLNDKHGQGAVSRMLLADLTMADVEDFNRTVTATDYSASQVTERLQLVKSLYRPSRQA